MKSYELVVLVHPDLEIDVEKAQKKVEKIIAAQKGVIEKFDNWGKRRLAYPIAKNEYAIYFYYELSLEEETLATIDRELNLADEVIRHLLTIKVEHPKIKENEDSDKAESKEDK